MPVLPSPSLQDLPQQVPNDDLMSDCLMFCFTGTDNLQTAVTPTPESFPHGKLLPMSPTWPFSEVQSSSAVDRIKSVLGASPDNTSVLHFARTPFPKIHRRVRAHGDFSSSPYQGSGSGTSLAPSKDSTKSLVQPRPQGGKDTAVTGLLHTSMLPAWSPVPSVTSLSPVLPSQPLWVGTPSISKQHSPSSDIFPLPPPSPSSPLAPDSPRSIIFSKPAERPTDVPSFPQTAPTDSTSSQRVAHPLNPFADEMNHNLPRNAQDFMGTPRLGFSEPSTKPSSGAPHAGPPTPEFLSSAAELAHLSPPPLALGSLQLPDKTPSWSRLEVASSPAPTQPVEAEGAGRAYNGVSWPALRSAAATREAVPVAVPRRKRVPAPAHVAAKPLHLSAAPENSEGPPLSAEHASASLVPSLPLAVVDRGRVILSGMILAPPSNLPAMPSLLQPAHGQAPPPPKVPAPQEGHGGPPPTAAPDRLLSGPFPGPLSTTWTFPRKEGGVTAVFKEAEKAHWTVAPQTLPSKETPSARTANGRPSDRPSSADLPSELPPRFVPSARAPRTLPLPPGFSSHKPAADTAVVDHSESPGSASKQVTAFPAATEVFDFSIMSSTRAPAVADVLWSSLSAETGSLSAEPALSGLLQRTNYGLNGHTVNPTSWETPSASSSAVPSALASAVRTIKSQHFKDTAGRLATAEGFGVQDPVGDAGTNQPVQQSDVTVVGNHTDILSISNNNHSRDFQAAVVEDDPSPSQHVMSHPHRQLPAHPIRPLLLTSPSLPSTDGVQGMLSDGMDTSLPIASNIYPSPVINASTPFQSILRYHHATADSPLSTSALLRTPSKVPLASQHPKKWTGAATNAGGLFPGTQKTGMTASGAKASSSSTQIPSFAQKEQTHLFRLMNELAVPHGHVLDPLLT